MAGPHAGRKGARWVRLSQALRAERRPCWLCGQAIDYTLEWPDPHSFSVDHVRSLARYPEGAEDPGNLRAAHLGCNSSKGRGDAKPGLGTPLRSW